MRTPSLAVTVMTAAPVLLGEGAIVTVRCVPLPPNTIFAVATKPGFDELAVRRTDPLIKPVSVNGIGSMDVLTTANWLEMFEIPLTDLETTVVARSTAAFPRNIWHWARARLQASCLIRH